MTPTPTRMRLAVTLAVLAALQAAGTGGAALDAGVDASVPTPSVAVGARPVAGPSCDPASPAASPAAEARLAPATAMRGGGGGQTPVGVVEDLADTVFGTCTGAIRPGVRATFDGLWPCTLNWVVQDETGALYVGTAGHCITPAADSCGVAVPSRTIAVEGVAADIGDAVYSTGNCGFGDDFALIRIDPALYAYVDATLCHWGGPQGMHTTGGTQALLHYGWGVAFSRAEPTRARAGMLDGSTWSEGGFMFVGAIHGGDSGSPIMVYDPLTGEGHAAGVITHTGNPLGAAGPGPQFASRFDTHLARAGQALGTTFTLVTSTEPVDLVGYEVP